MTDEREPCPECQTVARIRAELRRIWNVPGMRFNNDYDHAHYLRCQIEALAWPDSARAVSCAQKLTRGAGRHE